MPTNKTKCLLVDDDKNLCKVVSHQLESAGFEVTVANSGKQGLAALASSTFAFALVDIQMPDMDGLQVLNEIRKTDKNLIVIFVTAFGDVENAVNACNNGADDYLVKPVAKEQLIFTIEKAIKLRSLELENYRLRQELVSHYSFKNIITINKKMKVLLELAGRAAKTDAAVLILGESGTGKEMLAKAIHHNSPRHIHPFLAVNCPSVPESLIESELFGHEKGAFTGAINAKPGKFELAHKGTLFLDEIGDLRLDLQTRLLRVLQEKEIERVGGIKSIKIDVRIISATNQDLDDLVQNHQFRQDLFYRLNVIPLTLPPLRERKEDIANLAHFFIQKYSKKKLTVMPDFIESLKEHNWPGNIRELENTIQRAVALCSGTLLNRDSFTKPATATNQLSNNEHQGLAEMEKNSILSALNENNWNQTKTAAALKIPRHILLYRMKKFQIPAHPLSQTE